MMDVAALERVVEQGGRLPANASVGSVGLSPGVHQLPSFPVDALPGPLAEFVTATSIATQTPPDLPGGMVLAALASVAQGTAVVRCGPGWVEELALWIFIYLLSGERKSAVLRLVEDPVKELEREALKQARPLVAKARAERETLEARQKSLIRKVAEDKADPAELAEVAEKLLGTSEPVLPRMLADDATPEALASLLAQQQRMAIFAAESAFLDNVAGRYSDGGANLHLACQSYSGESARVDRRGRDPELLERPLLTLGLCVQPHVMERIAEDETMREQGFLARGAFLVPQSNVGARDTDPPAIPADVLAGYRRCIRKVYALRQTDQTDKRSGREASVGSVGSRQLVFNREAEDAFRTMRARHEPRLASETGDLASIGAWGNRHPGRVARIAALFHLAEHPPEDPIDAQTFRAAEKIGEHLITHALVALGRDPERGVLERTAAWLEGRDTVTVRDLHRGPVGGGKGSAERARRIAERLEAAGRLHRRPDPASPSTGGRPPSPSYDVVTASSESAPSPVAGEEWFDPQVPDHRMRVVEVAEGSATLHTTSADGDPAGRITLPIEEFAQLERAAA